MNFLDKFIFKQAEKRAAKISIDKQWQWPSLSGILGQGTSNSGVKVSEWSSLQLSIVYACVRLISNTVAMLPLSLYKTEGESSRIAEEKPLNRVLYRMANEDMTAYLFKQVMMSYVLLFGNAYAEIIRNGAGEVIELFPLAPWQMEVEVSNGEKRFVYETDNKKYTLTKDRVLHMPGLSFDGIKGYSPIQVMRNEIGLGLTLQQFGSEFFKNGANIGSYFKHPATLGKQAYDRLKKSIAEKYVGPGNFFKNIILEEGMDYQKIDIPLEDAQFIASRKFQTEEICRYYGIQPHMVQNLENATFSNIEQQSLEFKIYCIQPWATLIENTIWKDLLSEKEKQQNYFAKFNFNALMRADYATRINAYATGIQNGIFSPNDVHKLEDMNPIPAEEGGDTYFINSASVPIKQQVNMQSEEGGENNDGQEGNQNISDE